MKKSYEDIHFSTVTCYEDGSKGNEIGIMETLVIEWDTDRKVFKASNPSGHASWIGYGEGHTEAVLDYLKIRLGIN